MKRVRDVVGLTNVEVMIPFVRTLGEAWSRWWRYWLRTACAVASAA